MSVTVFHTKEAPLYIKCQILKHAWNNWKTKQIFFSSRICWVYFMFDDVSVLFKNRRKHQDFSTTKPHVFSIWFPTTCHMFATSSNKYVRDLIRNRSNQTNDSMKLRKPASGCRHSHKAAREHAQYQSTFVAVQTNGERVRKEPCAHINPKTCFRNRKILLVV